MNAIQTLRPGLLVSLSVRTRGNVQYRRQDIESTHLDEVGQQRARWETERLISDPEEHAAAQKVANKAGSLIRGMCKKSAFGLLCPEEDAEKLTAAIAEARALADEFNASAGLTHVSVNVLYGRIAQDDVEAVRAINGEIRQLMEDMQEGLKKLDVKVIRDAADKAKAVGEMLTPEAQARVAVAVEAARKSARQIVKAGDTVAKEVDRVAIAKIDLARTAFLDLDDEVEVATPVMEGRAVDLRVV